MVQKTISYTIIAAVLALSPTLADAGELRVVNNGTPLSDAMVSFESLGGESLATARTDARGAARIDLPQSAAGRPVVVKVTDAAGDASRHILLQPTDQPWHLTAVDTRGGIVGYDEATYQSLMKAREPVMVGANSDVGSGARFKEKAKETIGGLLGGALGGALGGRSPLDLKGGAGDDKFETRDDPVAEQDKRVFTDPDTGTQIAVGTQWTPDGLLISTDILNAPGDGTFQSMQLMDAQGNLAGPAQYQYYDVYQDWQLTMTLTHYDVIDGKKVNPKVVREWTQEGRIIHDTFAVPVGSDGCWSQAGFAGAYKGLKGMGGVFPASPDIFRDGPVSTVIHITRPKDDPVTTTSFMVGLAPTMKLTEVEGIGDRWSDIAYDEEEDSYYDTKTGIKVPYAHLFLLENVPPSGVEEPSATVEQPLSVLDFMEMDRLATEMQEVQAQLDAERKKLEQAIDLSRKYTESVTGINLDKAFSDAGYMDLDHLQYSIGAYDRNIQQLETELKDLERERERLKGRIDPVIDKLQPIVIYA